MKVIELVTEMQQWSLNQRGLGKKIAFVPTMGFLHEGHLSLLREGRKSADRLVLSIFVNPTQFGANEDFKNYPRDFDGDLQKARWCDVDVVFAPNALEIFPDGFQTYVAVADLSKPLCGVVRPGHFLGMATVVAKLFNIVQPTIALFGEKDFQQLRVIEQMVKDLNVPVEIKPMPIVREDDGLAMSSRNKYLLPEERQTALAISLSLTKAQAMVDQGNAKLEELLQIVQATLEETEVIQIDYVKLCDPETLQDLKSLKLPALLAIACLVGKTRLIDNCILT